MLFIGLGVLASVALIMGLRAFAAADPATIGRFLRWFLISLVAIGGIVLLVLSLVSRQVFFALTSLGSLALLGYRFFLAWRSHHGAPASHGSEVETATLRMRLDHATGTMSGTVLRGSFAGRRLDELSEADLATLLRECRIDDEEAARLLEVYLDRLNSRRGTAGAAGQPAATAADAMTPAEAYAVLGLEPGADAASIKEAHRHLMMKLHPDHGGSTYLAAKLNRAREVLLKT